MCTYYQEYRCEYSVHCYIAAVWRYGNIITNLEMVNKKYDFDNIGFTVLIQLFSKVQLQFELQYSHHTIIYQFTIKLV